MVPASLIANWRAEIDRFAPEPQVLVAHPSAMPAEELEGASDCGPRGVDLVITTYGFLQREPVARGDRWNLVVVDEAQAIKNPGAKQTRAVKQLEAAARIALTGTPIENRLGDLPLYYHILSHFRHNLYKY